MKPLTFVKPHSSIAPPVEVEVSLQHDLLIADFRVTSRSLYAKKQLARNEYPYEFDVVELFVTSSATGTPYFEFEVSPYNQALQVNVIEPRQEYHFGVKNGFEHSARLTTTGWEAQMRIPLRTIGCKSGDPLRGNAYAALGSGEDRRYWSLFELPPGKPDFHLPQAFRALF